MPDLPLPALILHWANEENTAAFAKQLASVPELRNAFIELRGELGAGKTTFVRHLLRALDVRGRIKSPTYAVVEPHKAPDDLSIFHFDFYRFSNPQEWEDAGFRDLFASQGLKLAEWPEKAAGQLPVADWVLAIAVCVNDSREVTVTPLTPLGQTLISKITT